MKGFSPILIPSKLLSPGRNREPEKSWILTKLETSDRVSLVSVGSELLSGGISLVADVKDEATEESNQGVCSWA